MANPLRSDRARAGLLVAVALAAAQVVAPRAAAAERIDHAGRILGAQPAVTSPLQFDTPDADAVLGALQLVPRDNAWVEDVSRLPLAPNSSAMIAKIIADTQVGYTSFRCWGDLNFAIVPANQALVDIDFVLYPDSSDDLKSGSTHIGSWPIPAIAPVETWPLDNRTLDQAQRGTEGGDRHGSLLMPGVAEWDTYQLLLTGGGWQAGCGARFPLNSNALRPDGWTSADAAGLPLVAGIVRYDECVRGEINHALRLAVAKTRTAHLYPATHDAGATADVNTPAMGQRLRLNKDWTIPSNWNPYSQAVARALKKYGLIVADNSGGPFETSHTPDPRFGVTDPLHEMQDLPLTAFEVVQATGATTGPRAPNAPTCAAGADRSGATDVPVALAGTATGSGLTTTWYLYDRVAQPGPAQFANAHALTTTVHLTVPGTYTVMLMAADGVHTPAYDALTVTIALGAGTAGATTAGAATSGDGGGQPAHHHKGGGCGAGSVLGMGLVLALGLAVGRRRAG